MHPSLGWRFGIRVLDGIGVVLLLVVCVLLVKAMMWHPSKPRRLDSVQLTQLGSSQRHEG